MEGKDPEEEEAEDEGKGRTIPMTGVRAGVASRLDGQTGLLGRRKAGSSGERSKRGTGEKMRELSFEVEWRLKCVIAFEVPVNSLGLSFCPSQG